MERGENTENKRPKKPCGSSEGGAGDVSDGAVGRASDGASAAVSDSASDGASAGGGGAPLSRRHNNLVIDIRDVSSVGHLGIQRLQHPKQSIEDHHWSCISNVNQVIDRGPTHVHSNVRGIDWGKDGLLSACAVRKQKFSHYQSMYHANRSLY